MVFLEIFQDFQISLDLVGLLIILSSISVFFYKKILVPGYYFIKNTISMIEKIDKIYAELHSNGGSSIKDAINRIEGRLVAVEQKQNLYLMESNQSMFETDEKGKFINVNRTLCRLVGKTERELMGLNWINSISGYDRDRVLENWVNSIEEKMEFFCKFEMVNSDEEKIPVLMVAYPFENQSNKKVIGWLGTINKIEDEKEF